MRHLCLSAGSAAVVLACALTTTLATAGPSDPMLSLLTERGLVHGESEPSRPATMRDRAGELVIAALNFLDVPYRFAGNSAEEGFDCSGFTRHVFEQTLGLALPRRSAEQADAPALTKVSRDELQPGDLVFFNTLRRAFSHVGIYVGDGKFVHSPRRGSVVRVEDMRQSYWSSRFNGARRAPAAH